MKVQPQPLNEPRHHFIVGVVEIKRNRETEGQAVRQIVGYMKAIAKLPHHDKNLKGFLVMGRKVKVYRLRPGPRAKVDLIETLDMFDDSDSLLNLLCGVAVKNWNRSL